MMGSTAKTGPVWPLVLALVAFTFVRGAFFAGLIPPIHGPDEEAHFDYVQRLAETGRLPDPVEPCHSNSAEVNEGTRVLVGPIAFQPDVSVPRVAEYHAPNPDDRANRSTTGCGRMAFYPPAYYVTGALAYRAVYGAAFFARFHAVRLAGVLWGCLLCVAAFFLGLYVFGSRRDALLLGLLVSAQPMVAFISSVVNNDAAMFATAAVAFAALGRLQRKPERSKSSMVVLGVVSVVGVLSKQSFVLLAPILFVGVVAALGFRRREAWLLAAATFVPSAVAALGWWMLTRVASSVRLSGMAERMLTSPNQMSAFDYVLGVFRDQQRLYDLWAVTYWMGWGWVDTWLSPGYYRLILIFTVAGAIGLVWGWALISREQRWLVELTAVGTAFFLLALHVIELRLVRLGEVNFIQARYLLPFFPLHATLMVIGLRALGQRLRGVIDAPWAFAALLLVLDLASFVRALERYYA
jgi:4-amino-4-deoxy-L-arabinose transferase-like glycosyltransferase